MARRGRRYVRSALGGATLLGTAIGGLYYFQASAMPSRAPSLNGAAESACTSRPTRTTCAAPTRTAQAGVAATGVSTFRDGTYAAQGLYLTPGGNEAIGVSLTLASGRVVGSQVDVEATSPTARQFQQQFATRYAPQVMSHDLASLHLSRVAGASLTSLGFDNALATIRSDALAQH